MAGSVGERPMAFMAQPAGTAVRSREQARPARAATGTTPVLSRIGGALRWLVRAWFEGWVIYVGEVRAGGGRER
jgi:hypothetical protein